MAHHDFTMPVTEAQVRALAVDDTVTLDGTLFGIRDATAFAVHVELAATHITMNPVAVNMQCHSARRSSAVLTADGIEYGY